MAQPPTDFSANETEDGIKIITFKDGKVILYNAPLTSNSTNEDIAVTYSFMVKA